MKILKILLFIISIAVAASTLVIIFFFSTGGIFGDCEIQEYTRAESPNGKFEMVAYMRNCGATTLAATVVALRENESASSFEDVFIAESVGQINVSWANTYQLSVILPKDIGVESVFKKEERWRDISISYK